MGILDEAIREHLELKRKRGAEQGELRQIEDEAFGPAGRPDADTTGESPAEAVAGEEPTRISALPGAEKPDAGTPEPGPSDTESSPSSEETALADREAIAQQPTEIFDVESELAREEAGVEETQGEPASTEAEAKPAERETEPAPLEAEPVAQEIPQEHPVVEADPQDIDEESAPEPQPELAPETEPEPGSEPEGQVDIFDEETLSEQLDVALEDPVEAEKRSAAFFDETDEFRAPPQRPSRQTDEPEPPEASDQDVLEETPDFLEEAPEHDRLWFEQKPPKDFDFND